MEQPLVRLQRFAELAGERRVQMNRARRLLGQREQLQPHDPRRDRQKLLMLVERVQAEPSMLKGR